MKKIVYPSSANPPTLGHVDLLVRAAGCFDQVYWLVANNPNKTTAFTLEQRLEMMQAYVQHYNIKNVTIDSTEGTVMRYVAKKQAQFLLRGLRSSSDFLKEFEMASANRGIESHIETVCLFAKPAYSMISSAIVRELAMLGESISQYVIPEVEQKIHHYLSLNTNIPNFNV